MRYARLGALVSFGLSAGCAVPPVDLTDDPVAYIESRDYRRGILERDLTGTDNQYAQRRIEAYAVAERWESLQERDPPSRPLLRSETDALARGENPTFDGFSEALTPAELPTSEAEWVALGRRVFFEFPLRIDTTYEALAAIEGGPGEVGFLLENESWVGLRSFEDSTGRTRIGNSCAQCHASYDEQGVVTGVLSNRAMDVGRARLLTLGFDPGALPPEIESTSVGDLDELGPGRTDLLSDGVFNPYAFPDFGGLVDLPYLHQNANWYHVGTATLAVRCETLFITADGERSRPPRVLVWALATYLRSLPPPAPLEPPNDASSRGEAVFMTAGCDDCHTPPLFTSDRRVSLEEIGTDPGAGESPVRYSGYYRIPSLRGVGRTAPYLHHGAFESLEAMFDPARTEPGHTFGLELDDDDRAALIAHLRTL